MHIPEVDLTLMQQRILTLLSDCDRHDCEEIRTYLGNPGMRYLTIRLHVHRIRKVLWPKGLDIITELHGRTDTSAGRSFYRLIRRLK